MSSKNQQADNIVDDDQEVIHGAGEESSSHIDRADKTAPLPEVEKGSAIPGMNASGGGNTFANEGEPVAGQGSAKKS